MSERFNLATLTTLTFSLNFALKLSLMNSADDVVDDSVTIVDDLDQYPINIFLFREIHKSLLSAYFEVIPVNKVKVGRKF